VVREPDPSEPAIDHYCYEANRTLLLISGEVDNGGSKNLETGEDEAQGSSQSDEEAGNLEDELSEPLTLDECNGHKIITITLGASEATKQGHCRYLISYTSRSASKDVYIYHFKTHTNTSTGTNHEWYRETALFAGNEHSEYQTIFASGETSTVDRVAILFTAGTCNWIGNDQDALDKIAQELANPCQ